MVVQLQSYLLTTRQPIGSEVLAVFGEPRRMGRTRLRPSFETPRKRAAPQDDGRMYGSEKD
jgi:hypothetical protein